MKKGEKKPYLKRKDCVSFWDWYVKNEDSWQVELFKTIISAVVSCIVSVVTVLLVMRKIA